MSPAVAVQTVYPFPRDLRLSTPTGAPITNEAVRDQLRRILISRTFARSPRISRFLSFAVDQTLRGEPETLKEYILGIEVFGRQESFDPRIDSIVRVEARRLRYKLQKYYETEGLADRVFVSFRKGCYVPQFLPKQAGEPAQDDAFDFPHLDPIGNARAFSLYARGVHQLNSWTPAGIEKCIALLHEAIEEQPGGPGSREALAGAWMLAGLLGTVPCSEANSQARAIAVSAAAARPDNSEAQVILGFSHAAQDLRLTSAESELRSAVRLNPASAHVRLWYGVYAILAGHHDTAKRQLYTAQQAAPGSIAAHLAAGLANHVAGDLNAALENYRLAREINSSLWVPHFAAGLLLADQGLHDQALHALVLADELNPSNPWTLAVLAYAHSKAGRTAPAAHVVASLAALASSRYVSPVALCLAYGAIGDLDQARRHLDAAFAERSIWLPLMQHLPAFAPLRADVAPLIQLLAS